MRCFVLSWLLSFVTLSFAQMKPDTTALPAFPIQDTLAVSDTTGFLRTESVKRDTVKRSVSGVDTVVKYSSSDSIVYSLNTRTMTLFGKGDIKYRQMRLKSEEIDVNWDTAVMNARGVADTSDTSGGTTQSQPTKKFRGTPVMIDGGEEYQIGRAHV